jgi:uncharacterized protein (TIGR02246 family)
VVRAGAILIGAAKAGYQDLSQIFPTRAAAKDRDSAAPGARQRIARMNLRMSFAVLTVLSLAAAAFLSVSAPTDARAQQPGKYQVVEVRVYTLKPGTRAQFHRLVLERALPLLRRWNVDVVAYGPSLHDDDSYFLMRAFPSLTERARSEDAFYGSTEWTSGLRSEVLAAIQSYSTAVVSLDENGVRSLRRLLRPDAAANLNQGDAMQETLNSSLPRAADLAALVALNDDYIRAVEKSDARRFAEILADDFVCSMSDGTQVTRKVFLEHVAEPSTISDLQAHDVQVRLMGDFAIIHARTTFRTVDGRDGRSRYTDVWARRDGRWLAIAAQVTRY